ncbi:hypothetical protein FS837_006043 [Tulasnella sp. UAMH 9824]|nr:hypothetical protein FS837_006043 [Tulasnella sp. UAMH 9824]
MDMLSVGDMLDIRAENLFDADISAEEIAQRNMTVLAFFAKSVAAKFAVTMSATAPATSPARRVWSLATGSATTMFAQLYVVRLALGYRVIYAAIALWHVATLAHLVVCGEPCEVQTCPTCAPDTVKSQVVDFIMQTSLSDVDLEGDGLDSRLITLKCGHVFTVKTLDGICELDSCYKRQDERWLQFAPPPPGLQNHPLCPLCRAPIKARRYGRVLKRVDLDMAEQNVANQCRSTLRHVSDRVSEFKDTDQAIRRVRRELSGLPLGDFAIPAAGPASPHSPVDSEFIPQAEPHPVRSARFGLEIQDRHQLPEPLAVAWNNAVKAILRAYDQACTVASTKSAHIRVWEAAVAALHHRYMDEPHRFEGTSPLFTVQEATLKKAKKNCGASSVPKADQRFRVEACWTTIHIRFLLLEVAHGISKRLRKKGLDTLARTRWGDFIAYILSSLRRDAALALEIAEKSRSYRQVVKTAVFMMEAEFQTFKHRLGRQRNGMLLEQFKHEARTAYDASRAEKTLQVNRYRLFVSHNNRDDTWLAANFMVPAQNILDQWVQLIQQLQRGVIYEEITDEERREIIRGLMGGSYEFAPQKLVVTFTNALMGMYTP